MAELILRLHEGDTTVDGALNRLTLGGTREYVTERTGLSKIGTLAPGDRLFVLGHGDPNSVGDKSAEALAILLRDAGLVSGVHVSLVACNTGSSGAPYALELKRQLRSRGIAPASVSGGTEYMQVKDDGSLMVADYDYATGQWKPEVTDGKETVNTPWGPRTRNIHSLFQV